MLYLVKCKRKGRRIHDKWGHFGIIRLRKWNYKEKRLGSANILLLLAVEGGINDFQACAQHEALYGAGGRLNMCRGLFRM